MYIVSIITYEDDYKHRYDSGVYPITPILFENLEKARKYVHKEMVEIICNGDYTHKGKYKKLTIEQLDELGYLDGNYVDKLLTYEITEVKCFDDLA